MLSKLTITKKTLILQELMKRGCGKHVVLIQKSEVKVHTGLNALAAFA